MEHLFESPMSLLVEGLPLTSRVAVAHYREFMIMMHEGLLTLELRPGKDGHFLTLTRKGLEWQKGVLLEKQLSLTKQVEVLEDARKGSPAEDTGKSPVHKAGPQEKRFRELKAGDRFSILVGKLPHKLKYRKVNDAEEDNAETDAETPELCTFPEDQLVIPASR